MLYIYDILQIGSKAYEITYNITKKGRVAARPFSCLFFVLFCNQWLSVVTIEVAFINCFRGIRMSELVIQSITKNDISACLAIYNYEVIHGVATLDLELRTLEEWHEWYNAHSDEHHPIIVGTIDDVVVGYASLSPYRLKDAFKSTVELSIYIHQDYRGQGVATRLMERILEMAKADTMIHNVVSVITAGNEGSTKLHNRFGFTYCGLTPEVGFKHGKYQDTETYALLV